MPHKYFLLGFSPLRPPAPLDPVSKKRLIQGVLLEVGSHPGLVGHCLPAGPAQCEGEDFNRFEGGGERKWDGGLIHFFLVSGSL